MKDENCEGGCRHQGNENGGEERRGRCCHSEPEASGARGGGECRCHAGKERGGSGGKGGGHCCCHSGQKGGAGCCSAGGGGDPRHGLKLWISAAAVALSFLAGEYPENLPLYPLTDPAWVAVILCAAPIFRAAGRSFFIERKITSPLLVSLAMAGAFALQIADFLGLEHGAGHGHGSYIFVAAEIAFLMSLGEWLEERTVRKSRMGIESLAKLLPKTATVKTGGREEEIPAGEIKKGQTVCVKAHSIFPVDARIESGSTSADESSITGESVPVEKSAGDLVYAGTANLTGYVEAVAVKDAGDSEMSKLARLVEEAAGKKAPISRAADRWAAWVIPSAIAAAVVVFFLSHALLGTSWIESAIRGVTILVVFCPCAFVLATPTAIAAGLGNAAKRGILVKSGGALETLAGITKAFFDKTGTLTEARMRVETFETSGGFEREEIASLAGGAEMRSEHPIGRAIFEFAAGIAPAKAPDSTNSLVGVGVEAVFGDRKVSLEKPSPGSAAAEKFKGAGLTAVAMKIDGADAAVFGISDTPRQTAKAAVEELGRMGIECAIISGDNRAAAEKIAGAVSIPKVYAPVLPAQKLEIISAAQREGRKVCMIGDGVNDAPALAQADSSIAVASLKNDIAIESAQISIAGSDLTAIPHAVDLSRATMRTIKANIIFSISLNLTSVVLAFFGIINPVVGALIHNASSVCVVANSARLLGRKPSGGA